MNRREMVVLIAVLEVVALYISYNLGGIYGFLIGLAGTVGPYILKRLIVRYRPRLARRFEKRFTVMYKRTMRAIRKPSGPTTPASATPTTTAAAASATPTLLDEIEKIRNSITYTEQALVVLCGISMLLIFTGHWFFGLIAFGITVALAANSEYTIPANPPSVGVPVLWGTPVNKVVGARIAFALPPFETFIEIDGSLKNKDTTFSGVRCSDLPDPPAAGTPAAATPPARRSGGSVSIKVGTTFEPDTADPTRLRQYINAGMEEKVNGILSDIIGETIREVVAGMSWEEAALSKELLSVLIIGKVVGAQPTEKVKQDANKNPVRNPQDRNKPQYQTEGLIDPATPIAKLEKPELEHFLDSILRDGPSDVRGLGIRIRRLNVIEVQPEGKLRDDAELGAREKQQRTGEQTDFETERGLIKAYRDEANEGLTKGEPGWVTYPMAAEWVRVNRGRAKENIVRSDNPLAGAASILGQNPLNPKG